MKMKAEMGGMQPHTPGIPAVSKDGEQRNKILLEPVEEMRSCPYFELDF